MEEGAPCANFFGRQRRAGRLPDPVVHDGGRSVVRRLGANSELFGSIQNVLDRVPPFDPLTYGAIGYNPLDQSGAVGRFFTFGFRHKF